MNSGRSPLLLDPTECSWGSNVTFRGGYPTNRQTFHQVALTDGGASGGAASGLPGFQGGFFQGVAIYDVDDGTQYMMVMSSGTLYQLTISGSGISVKGVWNDTKSNPNASQCWFQQADVYMVIQDGTSTPIIMQGTSSIRRATNTEVPVGQPMAYGQGRLFVASGRQIQAGDILGGPTSVISFTEQTYLSSAAYFGVPLNSGNVVGMTFVEQGDTATGQGELFILARNAAFTINAAVPRQMTVTSSGMVITPGWSGTPGIQRVALTNIGGTGQRNVTNVNMDILFRARDGWRSYRTARNEQYGWGTAPLSHEMNRVMLLDSTALLDYASSTLFKNRLLLTAQPLPYQPGANQYSGMFGGLVALDFDVISSVINKSNLGYEFSPFFTQRGSPAYDGFWSPPAGYQILQIISGSFAHIDRCFCFMLNQSTKKVEIWELLDGQSFDDTTIPVVSQIETRAFDAKLPDALKSLRRVDLYFSSVMSTINVTVEWRADGFPIWNMWRQLTLTGQSVPCNLNTVACQSPGCPDPGYWFQTRITSPPADCDINTGKLLRVGFYFQFRITWSGPATLIMLVMHATEQVEDPNGGSC